MIAVYYAKTSREVCVTYEWRHQVETRTALPLHVAVTDTSLHANLFHKGVQFVCLNVYIYICVSIYLPT